MKRRLLHKSGSAIPSALLTDLVAYYKCDGDFNDSLGIHDGTHSGGYTLTGVGGVGNALESIASGPTTNIPDADDFSFTDGSGNDIPFSISVWVYCTSFNTAASFIISKRNTVNGEAEWQISLTPTGKIRFQKFDQANNAIRQSVDGTTILSLNTWHHIVCTDNATETEAGMKIFLDSIEESYTSNSSGTYTGMPNGTIPVRLCKPYFTSSNANILGRVDEVGIWKNRVLTPTEITELYNSGSGLTYPF